MGERDEVKSEAEDEARLRFKSDEDKEAFIGDAERETMRDLGGNTCITLAENLSPWTSMHTSALEH